MLIKLTFSINSEQLSGVYFCANLYQPLSHEINPQALIHKRIKTVPYNEIKMGSLNISEVYKTNFF